MQFDHFFLPSPILEVIVQQYYNSMRKVAGIIKLIHIQPPLFMLMDFLMIRIVSVMTVTGLFVMAVTGWIRGTTVSADHGLISLSLIF